MLPESKLSAVGGSIGGIEERHAYATDPTTMTPRNQRRRKPKRLVTNDFILNSSSVSVPLAPLL
jgi:hypothetical protein